MSIDLSSTAATSAFAWLAKRRAEIGSKSGVKARNAEWRAVGADGKINTYTNGACHGGFGTPARTSELIANVSHWGSYRYESYVSSYATGGFTKLLPQADGERFYDWLVNRSFAAPYIGAPDLAFATNVGFVISTDMPGNVVLAICTLGRNCSEQAHIVKRWLWLIDECGASEDLAYVLAFGSSPAGGRWGRIIGGHNIVAATSLEYVENFVNHRIVKIGTNLRKTGEYYGVESMWGERGRSGLYSDLRPFTKRVATSEVVIKNPFKPVVSSFGVLDDDFIASVVPQLMEHLYGRPVARQAA